MAGSIQRWRKSISEHLDTLHVNKKIIKSKGFTPGFAFRRY